MTRLDLSRAEWKGPHPAGPDLDPAGMTVIVPASNEAAWIDRCLLALVAQDEAAGQFEVIVAANGCKDSTVAITRSREADFKARGLRLVCLDLPTPGKLNALNEADRIAQGGLRVYLDADVVCDSALLGQIRMVLNRPEPLYATGTLVVAPAESWMTRRYAALWTQLPFVRGGAVGAGFFAVNATGRARWGAFPSIISDDTYVRLHFAPNERIEVPAPYHWPMVEGFANLVRVRRRQDAGVEEVRRLFPALAANDAKNRPSLGMLIRLALTRPLGFAVYSLVHFAVRLRSSEGNWIRGR